MSVIAFNRAIGPVSIDCVLEEQHNSEIEITEIPIETGARITDHAFVLPKRVSLEIADENAAGTYNALVRLQESRAPFTVVTGLFVYTNMLIKRLDAKRDVKTSRVLRCIADLQEIIIVGTAYAADPTGGSNSTMGEPGGTKSLKAGGLAPERAGDAVTADRVSGTSFRGDAGTSTMPADRSILSSMF